MVTGFTLLARCAGYIPGTTFRRMRRTSLLLLLCVTEDAIFQRQCVRVCLRLEADLQKFCRLAAADPLRSSSALQTGHWYNPSFYKLCISEADVGGNLNQSSLCAVLIASLSSPSLSQISLQSCVLTAILMRSRTSFASDPSSPRL